MNFGGLRTKQACLQVTEHKEILSWFMVQENSTNSALEQSIIWIFALPHPRAFWTWTKWFHIHKLQCDNLKNWDHTNYISSLLVGLNEIINVKCSIIMAHWETRLFKFFSPVFKDFRSFYHQRDENPRACCALVVQSQDWSHQVSFIKMFNILRL